MRPYTAKRPYERSCKTKQAIQRVFLDMAATESLDRISVKSICAHLKITRSAFYYHYGNTRDVLNGILDDAIVGSGISEVFSVWANTADSVEHAPYEIALDRLQRYLIAHQLQGIYANPMLFGYMVEYVTDHVMNTVMPILARHGLPDRVAAGQAFRFAIASVFYYYRSRC